MSKVCYSPEGNPEMWDTCPDGYITEESWLAAKAAEEKAAHDAAEAERLKPENLIMERRTEVDAKYEAVMKHLIAEYPDAEAVFTFNKQAEDAAYFRETGTATPFLRTIADTRMISVEELVNKIERRKEVYEAASAVALGLRYYYKDALDSFVDPTTQQLLDLDISYAEVYSHIDAMGEEQE